MMACMHNRRDLVTNATLGAGMFLTVVPLLAYGGIKEVYDSFTEMPHGLRAGRLQPPADVHMT